MFWIFDKKYEGGRSRFHSCHVRLWWIIHSAEMKMWHDCWLAIVFHVLKLVRKVINWCHSVTIRYRCVCFMFILLVSPNDINCGCVTSLYKSHLRIILYRMCSHFCIDYEINHLFAWGNCLLTHVVLLSPTWFLSWYFKDLDSVLNSKCTNPVINQTGWADWAE